MTRRAKYKPTIQSACKNHPGVPAVEDELCENCLFYRAQGKSLSDRAAGIRPPAPPPPAHRSAARPPKIVR